MVGKLLRRSPGEIVITVFLVTLSVIMIYPIYNQLVLSLTGPAYIAAADGMTIWPHGFTLATYRSVLTIPKVYRGLLNSLLITSVGLLSISS